MEHIEGDYLYLAHPRLSMEYIREWQLDFEKRTGIRFLNPFYDIKNGKERDKDINEKDPLNAYASLNGSTSSEEKKRIKDEKCVGIVAIVDGNKSYGTPMEMLYTFEVCGKPVHSLVTDKYHHHPWVKDHSTGEVHTDRDSLERDLIELYGNNKMRVANG